MLAHTTTAVMPYYSSSTAPAARHIKMAPRVGVRDNLTRRTPTCSAPSSTFLSHSLTLSNTLCAPYLLPCMQCLAWQGGAVIISG